MPAAVTITYLADEFIATLHEHGMTVDRGTIEQEMRERINAIADRLCTTSDAVLHDYAQPGWARDMAIDVIACLAGDHRYDAEPLSSAGLVTRCAGRDDRGPRRGCAPDRLR